MCGIVGFIDRSKTQEDLVKMSCTLINRGPDDEGFYFKNGVGLGHRRLSIIDLSETGHQPMFFDQYAIVFNGEIYNYKELRQDLEKKGYNFTTQSDTEVILKSFDCYGPQCVNAFIGMFAFALYNTKSEELYLFRDRVGVKPLYYYSHNNKIAFASELKAFKDYLTKDEAGRLNEKAVSLFFQLGYIASDDSIVDAVKKLPPGHYLRYKDGKSEVHEYWKVEYKEELSWLNRSEDDLIDELENIIISSFKYRMVADVPVGVFLSAGVDSSLVAAVLSKHYGNIKTFTIGFDEADFDESKDAAAIASYLKTDHHSATLGPVKALEILKSFYSIYDEPHGDNSCVPTTFVSALAKSHGAKVVLSADGGDELFGGYTRYTESFKRWKQINRGGIVTRKAGAVGFRAMAMVRSGLKKDRLHRFADIMDESDFRNFYQHIIFSVSQKEITKVFPKHREILFDIAGNDPYSQMMEFDFHQYLTNNNLVKVDRATMFNSVEGREPFLDHRLIEFAAKLPVHFKIRAGQTKYILRKLLNRYLPEKYSALPKRGFGAPLQQWIQKDFKENLRVVFTPDNFHNPYLDRNNVLAMLDRFYRDEPVNMILLWFLYSFQLWYNKWNEQ